MTTKLSRCRIAGKEYSFQIINDIRYIDGKTVEDFMDTLSTEDIIEFAKVGQIVVNSPSCSPSRVMNELYQAKNN